jgi:hypothetical protein
MLDRLSNACFWKPAVPHDQRRRCAGGLGAVRAGAVDTNRSASGRRNDGVLVDTVGELDHQVQSRGDTEQTQTGQMRMERGHERVAPPPVDLTRPPEVAIERTTLDELRKRELVGCGRAPVCLQLRARDIRNEAGRNHEPGEAKGR